MRLGYEVAFREVSQLKIKKVWKSDKSVNWVGVRGQLLK